jgi:hypothetical protein
MSNTFRHLSSLILAVALVAPVVALAAPGPQDTKIQIRVFDRDHKDYHNWDDREDRAWGGYQTDHHEKSMEFSKSSKKEQSNYWNWRHAHPDKD